MEGIGLKDILALAMKGYKLDEIKELVSLGQTVTETAKDQENKSNPDPDPEQPEQEEKGDDKKDLDNEAEDSEQLKAKIIQLEDKIKAMQEERTKLPVAGENKSDQDILNELVKTYI